MSAEIHSHHCLWLMLAVNLSHSISGVAMGRDPHRLVAGAGQAAAVGAKRHTEHRVSVPVSGHRWVGRYRHSTTAPSWHRSHYACPDLLRSIALAPSWSVLLALSSPLATVLATNASARSLHKHSH